MQEKTMKSTLQSLLVIGLLLVTLGHRATWADFDLNLPVLDSAALADWTLNGSAFDDIDSVDSEPALLITPDMDGQTGSAFITNPLSFANDFSFNAAFSTRQSGGNGVDCCGDPPGADGLTFVIHDDPGGETVIGGGGGSLGVHNISPAVIIELDTWHGGFGDLNNTGTNGDHIALNINTDANDFSSSVIQTGPQPLGAGLNDGEVKNIWIDYDGNTKQMLVFGSEDTTKPQNALFQQTIYLDRIFDQNSLFVGYTGATGGARNEQVVKSFSMSSAPSPSTEGPPAPVPPPTVDLSPTVPSPFALSMPNFSDDGAWTLNGNAEIVDTRLQLTPTAGSQTGTAWLVDSVEMPANYAFNASFAWEISDPGGGSDIDGVGADGMTFVLQADANKDEAIGGGGGSLGLNGITPFVAVELDTWHQGFKDDPGNEGINGTHFGIDTSEDEFSVVQFPEVGEDGLDPRFNDGGENFMWVDYDGTTFRVYNSEEPVKPADPILETELDLAAIFSLEAEDQPIIGVEAEGGVVQLPVRFGFTAATGGATNTHEVISFDLSVGGGGQDPVPFPGDADLDRDFDQLDLVKVQISAKYLTGESATWGEGDWNNAPDPNSTFENPPVGDGVFDQLDIISSLGPNHYLTGPYAAITEGGSTGDGQTSVVYDAKTGELKVDPATGKELTSINITSAGEMFIGDKPAALDGAFDNFAADNLFKATFGGSFGEISFGNVLPAGIAEADLAADLSVVGSLAGGGDLGAVDLVYIPEPSALALLAIGLSGAVAVIRRRS